MPSKGESGKRVAGGCCASSHPDRSMRGLESLPSVEVTIDGVEITALVDTGCTKSMVQSSVVEIWNRYLCSFM